MGIAILSLAIGAAAGPAAPLADLDFRLPPAPHVRDSCRDGGDDGIVVCGRRDNARYRLRDEAPPRGMSLTRRNPFEWDLGGGVRAVPRVAQVYRPDGLVDTQVTIGLTIPF